MLTSYQHYPLLGHNTFGIAAYAHHFINYTTQKDLCDLIAQRLSSGATDRLFHIGAGSNLVLLGDFTGTILHSGICDLTVIDDTSTHVTLSVGAGVVWDDLVKYCVAHDYYGLENLSLIPGEVGAAAVQNIGAYGVEVERYITAVSAVHLHTGETITLHHTDCEYAYRHSIFKGAFKGLYAVTHVTLTLDKIYQPNLTYAALRQRAIQQLGNTIPSAAQIRELIITIRQEKLPDYHELGNVGSFFMNPIVSRDRLTSLQAQYPQIPYFEHQECVKIPAAWLIEQCGWKGQHLGRAGVYHKQALILVNLGGCTGEEIVTLSNRIIADVYKTFDIKITPEALFL